MIVVLIACFILASVVTVYAEKKKENWKDIQGVYLGRALVTNDIGAVLRTNVRIQIRHGKKNYYIMEMVYFDTKVAKFTKCARLEEYKINVADEVSVDGKVVRIAGSLKSDDGKVYNGKIQYFLMTPGERKVFRTFEIVDLKKASAY
jgi:hypothetical protein